MQRGGSSGLELKLLWVCLVLALGIGKSEVLLGFASLGSGNDEHPR